MHPALIALDPLFLAHVKLFIKDTYALQAVESAPIELYHYYDHIIKFVEISGIIVGIDISYSQIVYTLDDSTATVACCLWNEKMNVDYKPLPIGTPLRILGKLSTYRSQIQVIIQDLVIITDANEELSNFIQTLSLKEEYAKPYRLPSDIEASREAIIAEVEKEPSNLTIDRTSSEAVTEEAFADAMYRFFKRKFGYKVEFGVGPARDDGNLEKLATRIIIKKTGNENPSTKQISTFFANSLQTLVKKGLAAEQEGRRQWYILLNPKDLENYIMDVIDEMLQQVKFQRGGIRIEYIHLMISQQPQYAKLTKPVINTVISGLVDRGYIYPSGEREFKLALSG